MVLRAMLDYKQPLQSLNYIVIVWHPMCIGTLDECTEVLRMVFYMLSYSPRQTDIFCVYLCPL